MTYEKGSVGRLRQLERFRELDILAEVLEEWLVDAEWQARWIAQPGEHPPIYFARLVMEFCTLERVAELASWQAGQRWSGGEMETWTEEKAATVRSAMSSAMVLHADLLTPDAPEQK